MSACSFSTLRLNLVLTHGIAPDVHGGTHIFFPRPLRYKVCSNTKYWYYYTAAVLTRFVVVITYSRVHINRKVANPVQNISGYDVLLLYHIKAGMLIEQKVYVVHIETINSISTMEKTCMLYILKLICLL